MENAPNMVAPDPAQPAGHSGSYMLRGVALFVVGVLVGGAIVWFYAPADSVPVVTESPSPSPSLSPTPGNAQRPTDIALTLLPLEDSFDFESGTFVAAEVQSGIEYLISADESTTIRFGVFGRDAFRSGPNYSLVELHSNIYVDSKVFQPFNGLFVIGVLTEGDTVQASEIVLPIQ